MEFGNDGGGHLQKLFSFLAGIAFVSVIPIPVKWAFSASAILVGSLIVSSLWFSFRIEEHFLPGLIVELTIAKVFFKSLLLASNCCL